MECGQKSLWKGKVSDVQKQRLKSKKQVKLSGLSESETMVNEGYPKIDQVEAIVWAPDEL